VRFGKFALITLLFAALCAVGCKGEEKVETPKTADISTDGKDGNKASGPPPVGLNPNYHSNPAADDARTGSALKGK